MEWQANVAVAVCIVFAERRDLSFIATEGGEMNKEEMN
jgi:hypothetical protein